MSNVTITLVRNTFATVVKRATEAGVDTSRWALVEGSATYGNAFAIVDRDPQTGGQSTVMHLGFTRSDALKGLTGMAEAFYLALTVTQRRSI